MSCEYQREASLTFFPFRRSPVFLRTHVYIRVWVRCVHARCVCGYAYQPARWQGPGRKAFVLSQWKGRKVRPGNGRALWTTASTINSSSDLCFRQFRHRVVITMWYTTSKTSSKFLIIFLRKKKNSTMIREIFLRKLDKMIGSIGSIRNKLRLIRLINNSFILAYLYSQEAELDLHRILKPHIPPFHSFSLSCFPTISFPLNKSRIIIIPHKGVFFYFFFVIRNFISFCTSFFALRYFYERLQWLSL